MEDKTDSALIEVDNAFKLGRIDQANSATLRKYLLALANQPGIESAAERSIIRGFALTQMLLQRHVERLDRRVLVMLRIFVAIGVAVVVAAGAVAYAILRQIPT